MANPTVRKRKRKFVQAQVTATAFDKGREILSEIQTFVLLFVDIFFIFLNIGMNKTI